MDKYTLEVSIAIKRGDGYSASEISEASGKLTLTLESGKKLDAGRTSNALSCLVRSCCEGLHAPESVLSNLQQEVPPAEQPLSQPPTEKTEPTAEPAF